ncbi:MAG TPA: YheC/YheD family protein [Bacillota bacterium]|jgi:hypothetical protein|nr:YheC/YheD family protein [Bacillota bacterium]HOB86348.1 YheC/YheD family protein [Bacillota bacterium]HOP68517.1 YheC/YheD family protein [Bacillota bacterium]HPT33254.1 YheC/YheD family protein [Bacillota bacterium]HPZ65289.1 YheC/YheD family protein [Bacillota bacterium]
MTAGTCRLAVPLIGVFVSPGSLRSLLQQAPGGDFQALCGGGSGDDPLLYFFSLDDVDFDRQQIRGAYYHREKGSWKRGSFPFPGVVYFRNDAPPQRAEAFRCLLDHLNRRQAQAVNYFFGLNKWEVHRLLEGDPFLRGHLPATVCCRRDGALLESMLDRYGAVYLKACLGSRGRQVVKVLRSSDRLYEFSHCQGGLKRGRVRREQLAREVRHFFQDREYIIQQAVELMTFDGGPVDLRAEVQRNGRGELELVGIPVRVGHKQAPITTHARSFPFEDFFGAALHFEPAFLERLREEIVCLVQRIYCLIESRYGPCGELGIDLALDKDRRLWFIECNSRSARVSLAKAYGQDALHRSFLNALAYARHLSRMGSGLEF